MQVCYYFCVDRDDGNNDEMNLDVGFLILRVFLSVSGRRESKIKQEERSDCLGAG
jgi:hypothetical protein